MFTHVMVGSNDMDKAKAFYGPALTALGLTMIEAGDKIVFPGAHGSFAIGAPFDGGAATFANGGTIGFVAQSSEQVDAFHSAGCANGGACEGRPGPRVNPQGTSYSAYLRDPDGNKLCAIAQQRD